METVWKSRGDQMKIIGAPCLISPASAWHVVLSQIGTAWDIPECNAANGLTTWVETIYGAK